MSIIIGTVHFFTVISSHSLMKHPQDLLRTINTSLSKGKVREHLDGLFLLLDRALDQILDGNHPLQLARFIHQGQVTDVGGEHLFHAQLDGVIRLDGDQFAALGGNLLDLCFLGGPSQEGDLRDVVTFTDDSGQVPYTIGTGTDREEYDRREGKNKDGVRS